MANYYSSMYGGKPTSPKAAPSNKNTNRVIGGLKGQNAHTITIEVGGQPKVLPRLEYVTQIESQLKETRAQINELDKKIKKLISANNTLMDKVRSLDNTIQSKVSGGNRNYR